MTQPELAESPGNPRRFVAVAFVVLAMVALVAKLYEMAAILMGFAALLEAKVAATVVRWGLGLGLLVALLMSLAASGLWLLRLLSGPDLGKVEASDVWRAVGFGLLAIILGLTARFGLDWLGKLREKRGR